jgi:hypothetical protein
VAIVLGLLAIAFVKHIVDGTPANQPPPDFRPIVPGDNALVPPPGSASAGTGAPISGEIHIGRVIVVAPKADSGPDRSRN